MLNRIIIVFLLIFSGIDLYSTEVKIIDSTSVTFINSDVKFRAKVIKPNIIKFSYRKPDESIEDHNYGVNYPGDKVYFTLEEQGDKYILKTDSLNLEVYKTNLSTKLLYKNTVVCDTIQYSVIDIYKGALYKVQKNEAFYGFGSHAVDINRYGTDFTIYSENDLGYGFGKKNLNACLPIFISSNNYVFIGDNTSKNFLGMNNAVSPEIMKYYSQDLYVDFYIAKTTSYENSVEEICNLSGYQPMPPLWAFGYLQSKYTYFHRDELSSVYEKFKNNDFPLDALFIDHGWFGSPNEIGNLTWIDKYWKDPKQMISDFKSKGVKISLILEPYMANTSINYKHCIDNNYFAFNKEGGVSTQTILNANASLLDFTNEDACNWYWSKIKNKISDDGVSAFWCDMGEPDCHNTTFIHKKGKAMNIHSFFSNLWLDNLYNNWIKETPNKRPLLFSRAAWTGMQRSGAITWSGDCGKSYSGLKSQIPISLSCGIGGLGYMHSDAGGFYGPNTDPELYARWIQYSALTPILRVHSGSSVNAEPYNYPKNIQDICRKYIKLRYSLLPYIYTLSYENATKGVPFCRQLNFYDDSDTNYRNINDEYFFGKDLLVAPVVDSVTYERKIAFPKGNWVDFYSMEKYEGYKSYTVSAPIEKLPLFVRGGSIIPSAPVCMSTDFYKTDTLYLNCYYDSTISNYKSFAYIDDGINPNSIKNKEYEIFSFSGSVKDSVYTIKLNRDLNNYKKADLSRVIILNFMNKQKSCKKAIKIENNNENVLSIDKKDIGFSVNCGALKDSMEIRLDLYSNMPSNVVDINDKIEVYPNPASNLINIKSTFEIGEYNIEIFDLSGRKLIERNGYTNEKEIAVYLNKSNSEAFDSGTYIMRIRSGDKSREVKFNVSK
jgi:alpha-glucosidase (family GH31 glycosyl hydrolase)